MFTLSFFLPIFKSVHTYKGKMTMITNKFVCIYSTKRLYFNNQVERFGLFCKPV